MFIDSWNPLSGGKPARQLERMVCSLDSEGAAAMQARTIRVLMPATGSLLRGCSVNIPQEFELSLKGVRQVRSTYTRSHNHFTGARGA